MNTNERSLAGKVVAITGAGRGIGRATAELLHREGARVAIGDVDADRARIAAKEIGPNVEGRHVDVTDVSSFDAFLTAVEERHGPLDVLVNNAGIMPVGHFMEQPLELTRRVIDVNTMGVLYGTRLALQRMKPHRTGHVVNIASQAGRSAHPLVAAYCASKYAVVGFTEALQEEMRGTGIDISCVLPSTVNTDLTSGFRMPRAMPPIEPEVVAAAIVDVVRRPRPSVSVPKSAGVVLSIMALAPPSFRRGVARVLGTDKVMWTVDADARARYEAECAAAVEEVRSGA